MTSMQMDAKTTKADGISYDDTEGMNFEAVKLVVSRGLLFETEFEANGTPYGGFVIAADATKAKDAAFGRGLGEEVTGRVSEVWPDSAHWGYALVDLAED